MAMPAELIRQASRRLVLAALGVGLAFAVAIVLINFVTVAGWHQYGHVALRNTVSGTMIAISAVMGWVAHTGRLTPKRLLVASLVYETAVALGISLGDNLDPLSAELPLAVISWLCVWIAIFPLVVPAPPRWALVAGLASASTWPLAYVVGLALGNPAAPVRVATLNFLENYIAIAIAMFATVWMRQLHALGGYQLVEKLDHGGMGEIWRARHLLMARPVAVKLIRPELLGVKNPVEAAALVSRFRREVEATAGLHSPHTVSLHDFGVTPEGAFYYVMELLDGLDLESLVERYGPVPPARAIHLLSQACESLAEAHAGGLIHRDVKPANILTCHLGLQWDFVKVLDFGLVKATWGLGEDERLTSESVIAGTPAYIAPETALGGRVLDARVDIYGLGCVAYWLLTGRRVFAGQTPMEVLLHHVKTPPVPPSQLISQSIPESLESLVLSCLAKEPEGRPQSAEGLASRLAECKTDEPWTAELAREWWQAHGLGLRHTAVHAELSQAQTRTSAATPGPH
jgi:serine/threonine-protein kinase